MSEEDNGQNKDAFNAKKVAIVEIKDICKDDEIIENCVKAITTEITEHEGLLDEAALNGMIIGHVFETTSIKYLKDNDLLHQGSSESRVSESLLDKMANMSLKMPDGLVIEGDPPLITGVVEAKLGSIQHAGYRVTKQLQHFEKSTREVAKAYNPLGMDKSIPAKINVADENDFEIHIVHPLDTIEDYDNLEDVKQSENVVRAKLPDNSASLIFLPITRKDVDEVAERIQDDVVDSLDFEARMWIVQDDWVD